MKGRSVRVEVRVEVCRLEGKKCGWRCGGDNGRSVGGGVVGIREGVEV